MNSSGRVVSTSAFSTSDTALNRYATGQPARPKCLVLEESSLAGRFASVFRPYVTQLNFCEPRHYVLIGHGNKTTNKTLLISTDYFE